MPQLSFWYNTEVNVYRLVDYMFNIESRDAIYIFTLCFPNSVYFNLKLTVLYMSNLDHFYELRDESLLFSVVGSAMSSEVSFS